ncbi:MAG: hypothetical protein ACI8Z5_001572 [Lentimonas sp.]
MLLIPIVKSIDSSFLAYCMRFFCPVALLLYAQSTAGNEQLRAAVRLICAGHVARPVWARADDEAHAPLS